MQNDFVYSYDYVHKTALYDMIKHKHKNKPCNNINILLQAIKRISVHIPLIYYKRIRWSSNSNIGYNKAKIMFNKQLIKFWESKSIISLLSFGRKTIILIKSTCCNKMFILDPWRNTQECNKSKQYEKIINNAEKCGIWISIISSRYLGENMSNNADILARTIYISMKLQNIYQFDFADHPIDMVDNNILMKIINEPMIDSIVQLSISLLQKKHSVKFSLDKNTYLII